MSVNYRAYISVRDTKGLLELAGHLTAAGYDLACPIETASFLGQNGVEVAQLVSEIDMGRFGLVVCDLFDFQSLMSQEGFTDDRAREAMDIDHQKILLAAASHHNQTTIVCDRRDYTEVIEHIRQLGEIAPALRVRLISKVFKNIALHNFAVSAYFSLVEASKKPTQQQRLPF